MIRVLIVDDSAIARDLLTSIFASDRGIEVVGVASNGREAVAMAAQLKPDVVTMDIHMPQMNGFEATKEIMIESPTRIIIVSASTAVSELKWAMQALEVGALTLKLKPPGVAAPEFDQVAADLVETIKSLSDVKVVRHHRRRVVDEKDQRAKAPAAPPPPTPIAPSPIDLDLPMSQQAKYEVVAVAASTGGPPALHQMLGQLPENFPLPVLLVQHIADGFVSGFAAWLDSVIPMKVKIAEEGELLMPGVVYVGPHGRHLGVSRGLRVALTEGDAKDSFCPSADCLFRSCAESLSEKAIGIILTGMGRDGLEGLECLHQQGGKIVAQDEKTSVVFGMPRAAIEASVVDLVMPIDAIAPRLIEFIK